MKTTKTIDEVRRAVRHSRARGEDIGFVPTMGALHEGHLSLVRAAKHRCRAAVVSIFVNPAQFGPNEDFSKYPRTLEKDTEQLAREGLDILFTPSTDEMYEPSPAVWVDVAGLSDRNEGRVRPGHFRGVATVVAKLFNVVQPDVAFFGQKDAAQLAVIRRMVRELRYPVEVVGCPIVREADGLAMSSRNVYLSAEERKQAAVLSRALRLAEEAFRRGATDANTLTTTVRQELSTETVSVDYVEVLDPATLLPVDDVKSPTLLAIAARVGSTRLLDNVVLGEQ
ncbi:MAG TPA: pantoate--beta-alanine ligase [Terriglobales bacterium]|nr:pantoate--beta-alanine ligase [Terriglobales bacterium]